MGLLNEQRCSHTESLTPNVGTFFFALNVGDELCKGNLEETQGQ